MIDNKSLSTLLANNSITESDLEEKLYNTLILGVFEALCKDILKANLKTEEKEKYRKSSDKVVASKRIIDKYVGCCLSDEEYKTIAIYLNAFFSKDSNRKTFDNSFKDELLRKQHYKCAICQSEISNHNSHLDHIVPFKYVGDVLQNNYQILCETCNTRKGTSAYFEISMLLLNHK